MSYVMKVENILSVAKSRLEIAPLTLIIGKNLFLKKTISRIFWLLLRSLNPIYVSLFVRKRVRDERSYIDSVEHMIKTLSLELFEVPLYKLLRGGSVGKALLEGDNFYVELIIDVDDISLRIRVPDDVLNVFLSVARGVKAGDPKLLIELRKVPKILDALDPLLIPIERTCSRIYLGQSYMLTYLLERTLGEMSTYMDTVLSEIKFKNIDEWSKELLESIGITDIDSQSIRFKDGRKGPWFVMGCEVLSLLPSWLSISYIHPRWSIIEQPELCLHPESLVSLAKLISVGIKNNKKGLFIVTNSDYLLFKLNNLVLMHLRGDYVSFEEKVLALDPRLVKVYRVSEENEARRIEGVKFNKMFDESDFANISSKIYKERTQILRDLELGRLKL